MATILRSAALTLISCAAAANPTLGRLPTVEIAAGVQMPVVSLGTGGSSESLNVTDYTRLWLEAGGRAIDCALGYSDAPRVQVAIAASGVPRKELFLTSKCPGGGYNKTYSCGLQALADFQTQYLDLLLIHFPDHTNTPEDWKALEKLHALGKVRAIGVSNFGRSDLEALLKVAVAPIAVNQCEKFVGEHRNDDAEQFCVQRGITFEAYSPLGSARAGKGCAPHCPPPALSEPIVISTAAKHSVSPAQVALKWILQQPGKYTLTTQSHDLGFDKEDLDLFGFTLSAEEMKALDAAKLPPIEI